MIITFSLTVVPFNLIFLHLIHSYDILYHSYTFISQSWLTLTFKKKKNPNSWPIRLLLYLTLDRVKPNKEKVLNHVSFFFFFLFFLLTQRSPAWWEWGRQTAACIRLEPSCWYTSEPDEKDAGGDATHKHLWTWQSSASARFHSGVAGSSSNCSADGIQKICRS